MERIPAACSQRLEWQGDRMREFRARRPHRDDALYRRLARPTLTGEDVRMAATDENGEELTWQQTADRLNLFIYDDIVAHTQRGLTAEQCERLADEIMDRTINTKRTVRWLLAWMSIAFVLCVVGLISPVHTWLRAHLQFLWGVLVGSLIQSVPWAIDRWRWLRWFSWQ